MIAIRSNPFVVCGAGASPLLSPNRRLGELVTFLLTIYSRKSRRGRRVEVILEAWHGSWGNESSQMDLGPPLPSIGGI